MNLLGKATIGILRLVPSLAIPDRKSDLSATEYIDIVQFIRRGKRHNEIIMVRDFEHRRELIGDPTIEKDILTAEIDPEYDYLPYIQIGIEFLMCQGEIEDAHKGHIALKKHLSNIQMKPYEDERKAAMELMAKMFKKGGDMTPEEIDEKWSALWAAALLKCLDTLGPACEYIAELRHEMAVMAKMIELLALWRAGRSWHDAPHHTEKARLIAERELTKAEAELKGGE